MNERIKLLAEQAGEYAAQNATGDWEVGPDYQDIFNKKFAELIVNECKDLLFESSENNRLPIAVDDMVHIIDTHFGVDQGHPEEACDDEECYDVNPDW